MLKSRLEISKKFAEKILNSNFFKLKPLLLRGIRRDSFDCGIEALNLEVKQMKSELDAISPTNQFAAYFKKERSLKKLLAELNSLSKLFLP